MDKIKRGNDGEGRAAAYLEERGYQVMERNYRHRRAEIDLIVKKDDWLVFVEVKTRGSSAYGYPEEFVDEKKVEKILEGADHYLVQNDWQGNVRYDIIAISIIKGRYEIAHFEDAFH